MKTSYKLPKRLDNLLNILKETLPQLPGFRTLSLFGSCANGQADEYSDIDLIVTTDDLPNAKICLLGLLERINPIDFCWVINLRPDEWNPTVVLRSESYFHKLDIGLVDHSTESRSIPIEQTILLCDKHQPAINIPPESHVYVPLYGTIGHFLLGQYIGITRYIKARNRGQVMTSYRFAVAAMDWHTTLLYARTIKDPTFRSRLSTDDYRQLDELLPPADRDELITNLSFSNHSMMDRAIQTALHGMHRNGTYLSDMTGETLPADVFDRFLAFLDDMLLSTGA